MAQQRYHLRLLWPGEVVSVKSSWRRWHLRGAFTDGFIGRPMFVLMGLLVWRNKGNGTPLQNSCLENPMDGGARWAAVHGVAQSRTWLMRLSSSSSSKLPFGQTNQSHLFITWCYSMKCYSKPNSSNVLFANKTQIQLNIICWQISFWCHLTRFFHSNLDSDEIEAFIAACLSICQSDW